MEDITVIGFLPRPDIGVEAAWHALDVAAEDAGGMVLRRWRGDQNAFYGVIQGLDVPAEFVPTSAEMEIVGRGRLAIDDAAELPGTVEHALELGTPMSYGEVLTCICGSIGEIHRSPCPLAR